MTGNPNRPFKVVLSSRPITHVKQDPVTEETVEVTSEGHATILYESETKTKAIGLAIHTAVRQRKDRDWTVKRIVKGRYEFLCKSRPEVQFDLYVAYVK